MAKISKKYINNPPEDLSGFQFILEEMEESLSQLGSGRVNHVPSLDIYSTQSEMVVEIEVPGVRKEDIEVAIKENTLIIKGMKYECFNEKKVHYICMERAFGKLFRSIVLPCAVDSRRIKAVYDNGLLIIRIPRVTDRRGVAKKISVE